MRSSTGLRSTLEVLYRHYGGFNELIRSEYVWVSAAVAALCWRLAVNGEWVDYAREAIPALTGFSIAAYAIFFVILDEQSREALRAPAASLGNRSPLLMLSSTITHAVIVQVLGILFSLVYIAKPFPIICGLTRVAEWTNYLVSGCGIFIMVYGIVLVAASILSIFKLLEIKSRIPTSETGSVRPK